MKRWDEQEKNETEGSEERRRKAGPIDTQF